ncbi:RNA polymerase sigma factor [Streptomyces sp. NBC_00162]|uniref:RNA polymerase sigma factor n=1 Tax=Streptomyces sp. NBC_00162 TaxID=2903629 RepID=UPI00214B4208|nr:sigma-70 family RNA polymerase sigma factor [Streptomyces sp. NBC_00162]UUU45097.1 sigma-70 family RNA polymerase sigma factor [Streptomyces sp. NBC_00162]
MTNLTPLATPCLNCAAPVDLLDSQARAGDGTAEYLDPSRWCGRCMRYLDDWDRFFLLYQPRVRNYCLDRLEGLLPDNEDFRQVAEDIAQETMITAHRCFRRWDRPERAIWRTARNKVYKKCAAYRIVTTDGFTITIRHASPVLLEDFGHGATADPAQALIDKVVLYSALSRLPVRQQEALVVHKAFQVPAAAAGDLLERPGSTVKTQAQRALEVLREAAAKGALVILPGGALVGLYKVLEHVPFDTVSNSAIDLLTQPQVYPVMVALAAKKGVPYLRDLYRTHLGDRSRTPGLTPRRDHASDKHRHRGEL